MLKEKLFSNSVIVLAQLKALLFGTNLSRERRSILDRNPLPRYLFLYYAENKDPIRKEATPPIMDVSVYVYDRRVF